jgi:signal peptidase I
MIMIKGGLKSRITHALLGIGIAGLTLFFLFNYVVAAIQIQGNSMDPVLRNREKIIVLKLSASSSHIDRFDIIVFVNPEIPSQRLIKRVIGLPGEQLEIRQGQIWINNKIIKYPTRLNSLSPRSLAPVKIPGHYFYVIGDNRISSRDSGDFGPIHIDTVIGKAFFRYWPFSRLGKIS